MRPRVLVLGIGNILWADEGFGVRAVEAFHRRYELPDRCRGAGWRHAGALPGELCAGGRRPAGVRCGRLRPAARHTEARRDAEVPKFTGEKKMSLHQTGFQEVLSAADLLGALSQAAHPDRLPAARSGQLGRSADPDGARRHRSRHPRRRHRPQGLGGSGPTACATAVRGRRPAYRQYQPCRLRTSPHCPRT